MCRGTPQSVAELAADLDLSVGVVRVLLGDLPAAGLIRVNRPAPPARPAPRRAHPPGGRPRTPRTAGGRITIREGLSRYLFGTPGKDRFWFLRGELAQGALGAVVPADTRRPAGCFPAGCFPAGCFPAVDFFEHRGIPFVVAVNRFAGTREYGPAEVDRALDLDPGTPVVLCDARRRASDKEVLINLVEHAGRVPAARLLADGSPSG
ncbi:DUF742 domain-containing protein [Streptomyces rubellomurinus]|uniref:DUF742 domain-containing protein n=1 Tax=Streptomyces rubellomurinus (strain ATCC 31215) TaxID=359131 RepID=UPI001FC9A44A|nr:DUF742 domain-containing protein [Streptomyces rubellomurinus]